MEYFTEAFEEHTQLAAKIAIVLVAYVIYRVWMEGPKFPKRFSAAGKVIIVTGAASGIGKETAMEMAERGGRVILACRNKDTAIATRDAIVAKTGNVDVHFMYLDLNSLNSVRSFVQEFLQQNKRLDLLINNASIIGTSKHLSDDGLDMHMAVNHYGTFLLTSLLLDILKTSVPSRIVTVSSAASERAVFCKEYIETQKTYGNNFQAYAQSKLANILFTRELSSHLRDTGVTANCVNPGACYSELAWQLDRFSLLRNRTLSKIVSMLFYRTARSRAQCTLYAALDFNLQNISGQYLSNMWFAKLNDNSKNVEYAKWLWKHSENVTGLARN